MAETPNQPILNIELGEHGDRLSFKNSEELRLWISTERNKWVWLREAGRPMADWASSAQDEFYNQLDQFVQQWQRSVQSPQEVINVFSRILSAFDQFVLKNRRVIFSTNPAAPFIASLREKRGDRVAAGAYLAILSAQINTGGQTQSDCFEGIIEAFLYKREIDWAADAQQKTFNRLKGKYEDETLRQDQRFQQLVEQNQVLNIGFEAALKEKSESLNKLHAEQASDYAKLTEQHVAKLSSIETAYDQKLALQKPVEFWDKKEKEHRRLAKLLGWYALATIVGLATALGVAAYLILSTLAPNDNPKHWQIGVLAVALFFSIWVIRILVRMFLSNLHLAEDAAERRTMILTYLSMAREGSQFEAKDKHLILQHLFRSASDGLVKDDAAPPTPMEVLTRR